MHVRGRLAPCLVASISLLSLAGPGVPASADSVGGINGYQLSVVAGRPDVVSGSPATTNAIDVTATVADSAGDVFIADRRNGFVEKVAPDGTLTIVAGNGDTNSTPTSGQATATPVQPVAVALDESGDLFIGDSRGYVEKVTPAGALSIVLAANSGGAPAFFPSSLAVDGSGNLYVGDRIRGYVTKMTAGGTISRFAGSGDLGDSPANGPAASSPLDPLGLAADSSGNVYIASAYQSNGAATQGFVVKVTPAGTLSTVSGGAGGNKPTAGPAAASGMNPIGIAIDASNDLIVADAGGYVEQIDPSGNLSIVAGDGDPSHLPVSGAATSSPMTPVGIGVDGSGNIYVASGPLNRFDTWGVGLIAKVAGGNLSLIAGGGKVHGPPVPGPATSSPVSAVGTAVDPAGNVYIADAWGYVEKVTPAGVLSIVAGDGTFNAPTAGPATSSGLDPVALALDASGDLYVADGNGYVEKVTPGGALSVVAGNGNWNGNPTPGPATASIVHPVAVAVDSQDNLYIADGWGYVEKVTPAGTLTVIAGNGNTSNTDAVPGPATSSPLQPFGVAVDQAGVVYIAGSTYVVKVTSDGTLSVVAGNRNGTSQLPTVDALDPRGIAVDGAGSLYLADEHGYLVKLTSAGALSIIGGNGNYEGTPIPGPATFSPLTPTGGVAVDATGDVYVTAESNAGGFLVKVSPPAPLTTQASGVAISGPVRAGAKSTAIVTGSWTAGSTTLTPQYQWYNVYWWNGQWAWDPVPGATQSSYTPQLAVNRLGVKVTAVSPAGYQVASTVTSSSVAIGLGVLTAPTPVVRGTPRVGYSLRLYPGVWMAGRVRLSDSNATAEASLHYQWFANGVPIRGATWAVLHLTRGLLGKAIRVRVTGAYPSYATTYRFSSLTPRIRL